MPGFIRGIITKAGGGAAGLRRDQRGQVAVFFALAMMALVCFLAFLVNVGQVVHDRVLCQAAADMIAYSAANVQAVGLNEVADTNQEIQKLLTDLQGDLARNPWWKGEAEKLIKYYRYWLAVARGVQGWAVKKYALASIDTANATLAWFNARYGPGGSVTLPNGKTYNYPQYSGRKPFQMELIIDPRLKFAWIAEVGPSKPVPLHWVWVDCLGSKCAPITVSHYTGTPPPGKNGRHQITRLPRPIDFMTTGHDQVSDIAEKGYEMVAYMRVRVWRDQVEPYVEWPSLGFDVDIPKVEAYAAAQPTGGRVNAISPTYRTIFVPLRTIWWHDPWNGPDRGLFRH